MNLSKARLLLLGFFVITTAVIVGTALWLKLAPRQAVTWNNEPETALNVHGAVPDFALTERSGRKITLTDLRGKPWIADFIYTTCTDTCPLQSAEMSKLQEEIGTARAIRFVSFSVDPEKDTPGVLREYAQRFKADTGRWLFLTGDKEQISSLVETGFHLSAAPLKPEGSAATVILHSPRFVLVDKTAAIRGYYDSREPDAIARLITDARTLLNEQ